MARREIALSIAGARPAANLGQNVKRLQAGIQCLRRSNRTGRPRWVSTKLNHEVFHRIDEIRLRHASSSVRVERTPGYSGSLRLEDRRRIECLKRLIKLSLIDRSRTTIVDLIEQRRHLLTGRHARARTRHNLRAGSYTHSGNGRSHRSLQNFESTYGANYNGLL